MFKSYTQSILTAAEHRNTPTVVLIAPLIVNTPFLSSVPLSPDIDECGTALGRCPPDSYCSNTEGSYQCRGQAVRRMTGQYPAMAGYWLSERGDRFLDRFLKGS